MLRLSNVLLILTALAFTLWSCDDDSPTGPDLSDAPDAPTMQHVEMDFSVFENADNFSSFHIEDRDKLISTFQSIQDNNDEPAFEHAALFASIAELWFQTMGQLPNTFFQQEQWGEPDYVDGTWVWEWSFAAEGESVSITITAETVGDERHWELRYTTQGTENDLENALLIASQIRLDGSGGEWQLYDFLDKNKEPVFLVEYELDGDVTTFVDMRFNEEEEGRFRYERDGDISTLQMWDIMDGGTVYIQWNNESGEGFIESPNYRDGERVCWDDNFQNTEC